MCVTGTNGIKKLEMTPKLKILEGNACMFFRSMFRHLFATLLFYWNSTVRRNGMNSQGSLWALYRFKIKQSNHSKRLKGDISESSH